MNLFVGTSGYSYKAWKGSFYPEKFSEKNMLNFYAKHFNTVEINNTFYKMPKPQLFETWKDQVDKSFKFVIKAPRRITHTKKLENNDSINFLLNSVAALNDQLGVLLFQFPPYFKKDLEILSPFTSTIPQNIKAAFEFRHDSWFSDDVYNILNEHNFSLCLSDTDDKPIDKIIPTADWTYLRLRKLEYNEKLLTDWCKKITEHNWNDVYVFFKHEDEGTGPKFAKEFLQIANK